MIMTKATRTKARRKMSNPESAPPPPEEL